MRIAISGSGGTGKSTLAEALSGYFGIPRVSEGVRDWMKEKGVDHLREMTPGQTLEMQKDILRVKMMGEQSKTSFVADRCTADNVAYALRWIGREDEHTKDLEEYMGKARHHAVNTYDLVLFLPYGSIPLQDDGVRSPKPMYQQEISLLIKGILLDWRLPVYTLRSTSRENRLKEASEVIGIQSRTSRGLYL